MIVRIAGTLTTLAIEMTALKRFAILVSLHASVLVGEQLTTIFLRKVKIAKFASAVEGVLKK